MTKINKTESLKQRIRDAFADVPYPGDSNLRGSNQGDEPFLLEDEFRGKTDWSVLEAGFLDQAPDGFATALCFFSDEAFRFYLPAYLIADIDGLLERTDPVIHLCLGLNNRTKSKAVNSLRYGDRTWFDIATTKFATFSQAQATAITDYLNYRRNLEMAIDADYINQALQSYWNSRVS